MLGQLSDFPAPPLAYAVSSQSVPVESTKVRNCRLSGGRRSEGESSRLQTTKTDAIANRDLDDRGAKVDARCDLIKRTETGFAIPIGEWLTGPLRTWAEGLLAGTRLRREGLLSTDATRALRYVHCPGRFQAHKTQWHTLIFQAWSVNQNTALETSTARTLRRT